MYPGERSVCAWEAYVFGRCWMECVVCMCLLGLAACGIRVFSSLVDFMTHCSIIERGGVEVSSYYFELFISPIDSVIFASCILGLRR